MSTLVEGWQQQIVNQIEGNVAANEQQFEDGKLNGALLITKVSKGNALECVDSYCRSHHPYIRGMVGIAHCLRDGMQEKHHKALLKRMLSYSWPILVLGVAGILNQTADKILFPYIYKGNDAHMQLGIYGAASKIAMIMAMITQAFRYAYEPFVFGKSKDKDNRDTYAKAMKYFIIFTLLAFLVVMGYINVFRHFIGRDYWEGLRVVPIVMAAEIMMGIYFNLSFWYKLVDKTIWGAYFSGIGCVVLIAINVLFVPRYGYMACAWAGFAGYATAMILSYIVGQRKYPIAYPLRSIFVYVGIAAIFYFGINYANTHFSKSVALGTNTVFILLFIGHIWKWDLKRK